MKKARLRALTHISTILFPIIGLSRNEESPIKGIDTDLYNEKYVLLSSVEMKKARLRALTQALAVVNHGFADFVEMKKARLRALTRFLFFRFGFLF